MLKALVKKWDEHKKLLKAALAELPIVKAKWDYCARIEDYTDIVKLTFDIIYNTNNEKSEYMDADTENIAVIDNGEYQGAVLYLIPLDDYSPMEYDYLMTYVNYGSCSGCDTLQRIAELDTPEEKVRDLMILCKDIITNTIKPYNCGWREDKEFEKVNYNGEDKI